MKTKLILTSLVRRSFSVGVFFLLFTFYLFSQAPESFNYQAVARDNTGQVLQSQQLNIKIGIFSGSAEGTLQWEEIHDVTTNESGLFTIQIGTETKTNGDALEFSAINWNSTTHFLNVQVDAGNNYVDMGTSQLLSVPYALSASSVSDLKKLNILGPADQPADSALFEVRNKDGQTVFAVYNEGVRVYVDTAVTKGLKGGFAVGGFGSSKDNEDIEYFRVTPDSVRVYVDTVNSKGLKGGFAVGGFGSSKGLTNEYLRVTPDSVRIYINESMAKGLKGGFAVGGFNSSKGTNTDFMHMTPDNYFIGHESGSSITTGLYNSFMGYKAGVSTTTGNSNVFIGHESGFENLNGNWNVFVGNNTGQNNTTGFSNIIIGDGSGEFNTGGYGNVIMGDWAGRFNTTGNQNVFIGAESGHMNDTGSYNVFIGESAGHSNLYGEDNVFIGSSSGYSNNTGSYNVFMGSTAGENNLTGDANVFIGETAGNSNTSGEENVFIGTAAGESNDTGSYNVFIGSSSGSSNTTGNYNVFMGEESGFTNSTGRSNVFIGLEAGRMTDTGNFNVFLGTLSGRSNDNGFGNVYLGQEAGYLNQSGNLNVAIGPQAGYNNLGENNIFIGPGAGFYETGDSTLYIDNSWSTAEDALIYGDFSSGYLSFNADVDIIWDLDVGGDISGTSVVETSDIRWKENITNYDNALDKLMKIRGVNFDWKRNENIHRNFSEGNQIGVIAQEIEKIIPELVKTDDEGYKLVSYSKLTVVLIEAVKEQQKMIEELKGENSDMKFRLQRMDDLQDQIDQLKNILNE